MVQLEKHLPCKWEHLSSDMQKQCKKGCQVDPVHHPRDEEAGTGTSMGVNWSTSLAHFTQFQAKGDSVWIITQKMVEQCLGLSLTFTRTNIWMCRDYPHPVCAPHTQRVFGDGEKVAAVECHSSAWDLCFGNKTQQKSETANKYISKNNRHQVNIKTER